MFLIGKRVSKQICLKKIFKNYLDSYASYICKKITVFHVDKLSLCYLLHPVIHKHDSNNISTNPFPYTFSPLPYLVHDLSSLFCLKCTLYSVHPSILFAYNGPTNQNNQLWLGNYIVNCDLLFVLSSALLLNKNMKYETF